MANLRELGKKVSPLAFRVGLGVGVLAGGKQLAESRFMNISQAANPPTAEASLVYPIDTQYFTFFGVPDLATNVELADPRNGFVNTLGMGTRAFTAEPGGGIMGRCDIRVFEASNGYIDCATSANSNTFRGIDESVRTGGAFQIPEGGWMYGSFQDGVVWIEKLDGTMVDLNFKQVDNPPNNTLLLIRGYYPDGGKSDRNRTARLGNLISGHNWFAEIRSPKANSNVAFISEGWLKQQIETSLSGGSNCGDSGCATTVLVYHDLNTGATGAWLIDGGTREMRELFRNYRD